MTEKHGKRRRLEHVEGEDWISLTLRIPPTLMDFIKQDASEEFRSLNSQILWILDQHRKAKSQHGTQ
jgi:hypothetical protein